MATQEVSDTPICDNVGFEVMTREFGLCEVMPLDEGQKLERELRASKIVHDSYAEIAERDLAALRAADAGHLSRIDGLKTRVEMLTRENAWLRGDLREMAAAMKSYASVSGATEREEEGERRNQDQGLRLRGWHHLPLLWHHGSRIVP